MEIQITDLTKAAHAHRLSDAVRAHTRARQHLLFLDPTVHLSWHGEAASLPPPLLLFKLFRCSPKAFYYLSYPEMSDFIKEGKICISWIILTLRPFNFPWKFFLAHQSGVWSGSRQADAAVSDDQSLSPVGLNHPGDCNELRPQLSARISSRPGSCCCRRVEQTNPQSKKPASGMTKKGNFHPLNNSNNKFNK